jgi:OmpA-OmpF porin, OOP family
MLKSCSFTLAVLLVSIPVRPVSAQEDCEGCKDLTYLSRMPSYSLSTRDESEFNEFTFFDGAKMSRKEGRLFKLTYNLKEDATRASSLQIRRNYANALRKAGGTVFNENKCEGEKCGDWDGWEFLAGKLKNAGKEVWVHVTPRNDGVWYELTAMEVGEMKQDVSVSADDMSAALGSEGHIALYINFEANKATILPDSQGVIDEIHKLLSSNESLKVALEGHTDNTGDAKLAQKLSEDRAKAVQAALVKKGIAKPRIATRGFGPKKPIADNSSEEGRAKNRRVELVKVE